MQWVTESTGVSIREAYTTEPGNVFHTGMVLTKKSLIIDGLHMMSWRPCWWTGAIRFFSSGSSLPFLCKLCEQIFFCFVHPWWKTSQDLQGSLKIFKDLPKIFKDKDPQRILIGSLKILQRSSKILHMQDLVILSAKILKELVRILQGSL